LTRDVESKNQKTNSPCSPAPIRGAQAEKEKEKKKEKKKMWNSVTDSAYDLSLGCVSGRH
jgi:hypothetical protein